MPKGKNKKPVNKDRFISKMFLRYVRLLDTGRVMLTGVQGRLSYSQYADVSLSACVFSSDPFLAVLRNTA